MMGSAGPNYSSCTRCLVADVGDEGLGAVASTYGVSLAIHWIAAAPTIAALAEIVTADLESASDPGTCGDAGLQALSDEELDDLLRAIFAARDRRRR